MLWGWSPCRTRLQPVPWKPKAPHPTTGARVERAIEIFAAINFLILGLSHVFQHRAWTEFFVRLREKGHPGAFANGFLTLFTGSLIVAFPKTVSRYVSTEAPTGSLSRLRCDGA